MFIHFFFLLALSSFHQFRGKRLQKNISAHYIYIGIYASILSITFSRPSRGVRPPNSPLNCDTGRRLQIIGRLRSTSLAVTLSSNRLQSLATRCELYSQYTQPAWETRPGHASRQHRREGEYCSHYRSFFLATTSEYGTTLRELSSRTSDTRLFRFHAHLGDYAGTLCKRIFLAIFVVDLTATMDQDREGTR